MLKPGRDRDPELSPELSITKLDHLDRTLETSLVESKAEIAGLLAIREAQITVTLTSTVCKIETGTICPAYRINPRAFQDVDIRRPLAYKKHRSADRTTTRT